MEKPVREWEADQRTEQPIWERQQRPGESREAIGDATRVSRLDYNHTNSNNNNISNDKSKPIWEREHDALQAKGQGRGQRHMSSDDAEAMIPRLGLANNNNDDDNGLGDLGNDVRIDFRNMTPQRVDPRYGSAKGGRREVSLAGLKLDEIVVCFHELPFLFYCPF